MLTVFLCWLVTAWLTVAFGWVTWKMAARMGLPGTGEVLSFEWLSLTGISVLTVFLTVLSLFLPLNEAVQIISGTTGLVITLAGRKSWWRYIVHKWQRRGTAYYGQALLVTVLIIWLLWRAANPTTAFDTGLYHLQTLQWIERYPAVPGLGNLHGRLAFNSSLFLPMALLRYGTPSGPAYCLGSYFYLLMAVVAARRATARHAPTLSDSLHWVWAPILLFFALIYCFQVWLSSTYSDCPLAVLLGLLFLRFGEKRQSSYNQGVDASDLLLLLLALIATTIKLSAAPVLLLPAYKIWQKRRLVTWPWLVCLVALVVGVVGPWLARSVVLSGYLIYPLPALDVFAVDWKVPATYARMEQNIIANTARQAMQSPYAPFAEPWHTWLPHWWSFETPYTKAVLLLAALSPLVVLVRWQQRPKEQDGWLGGWLVAWLGSTYWFFTAPDFRFGAGFLLVAGLWPWLSARWLAWSVRWQYAPMLLVLFYALHNLREPVYEFRTSPATFLSKAIWPALPPVPETVEVPIRGIVVRVPRTGVRCWGAPLPCSFCVEADLAPRGATLAEGFRWQKSK
ncbi:LIC_10190 family membrane protein [Hymenobacter jejuensis]|uniref:LIC_10190 family membrane protein n=1 Tax=Hymenobacter jejuensis TaxID=2502781 RepID=UPI0013FCFA4C|nr:hypothetical protein [Hymenobacter jejuensis]